MYDNLHSRYTIRYNTIVLWLLFIVLTFFVGFRWDVGIDWLAYMDLFGEDFLGNSMLLGRIEPANLLIKILLLLNGLEDGGYYLWVMAFLTMFFFFYAINKYSVSPLLSVLLFILLGMYFDLMNGVRQYLAIALTTFSWQFLFKKSMIRYFITILVASLFHNSAIIMLPIYFVCTIRFNKQFLIVMSIISIPLSLVITPIVGKIMGLFASYEVYADSAFSETSNMLSYIRSLFPLSLLFIIIMKYDELIIDRKIRILTNLSIFCILCTMLFPGTMLMIRIGFYFQMAYIFLIPILCRILSPSNGVFFQWYSLIYALAYITITQLSRPIANILPFEIDFRLANWSLVSVLFLCLCSSLLFIRLIKIKLKKK